MLAYEQEQLSLLDNKTPEGLYNQILARTDNMELATQVLIRAREAVKLRELQREKLL